MAITATGVGSGLDVESIVTQLMSIERQPLTNLRQKESQAQAQISAFGSLKSALSSFQDAMDKLGTAEKFKVFTAASTDEQVLTASTDSAAASGSYNLDVQRLAQNHKLGSSAFASGTTFGGTAGDSLTVTVNGNASAIDLSTAQDINGVRDAINSAADNPGVTATVINSGDGNQYLVLTSNESGYDQRIELSYGGGITAGTFGLSTLNQDSGGVTITDLTNLDAAFSVDGIAVTAASNQVSGVVDGLTLDLKGVGSATLSVGKDTESIQQSAQDFVDAYNAVIKKVSDLKSGALGNDSLLRNVVSRFQSVLNTPASGLGGSFSSLSELGLRTNAKTGELELDTEVFSAALETDFSSVAAVFSDSTTGYATRFQSVSSTLLDTGGLLDTRVDTLNSRVSAYQTREANMEANLTLKEKSLRAQYAALDSLISNLNSTGSYLASQFK